AARPLKGWPGANRPASASGPRSWPSVTGGPAIPRARNPQPLSRQLSQPATNSPTTAPAVEEKGRAVEPEPVFRPQKGPQSDFLTTQANIAIYGGAAGG